MSVKHLDKKGTKLADSVYSEYPCLLIGNKYVQKANIALMLKKMTTINDKIKNAAERASLEKIKRLEVLCQTQLHLISVSTKPICSVPASYL